MQSSVTVLERLKRQMKRSARLAFAAQERERQQLESQLEQTEQAIDTSRHQPMEEDITWLAEQHSHRLRLELRRRREAEQLNRQARVVERHRTVLHQASQEARLMELLVEQQDAEEQERLRRIENTELDAMAMARWAVRCA